MEPLTNREISQLLSLVRQRIGYLVSTKKDASQLTALCEKLESMRVDPKK